MICTTVFILFVSLCCAQPAVPPFSHQFQTIGLLTKASLDPSCNTSTLESIAACGGKLETNGQTIIVPGNLMVVFPANYLSWGQLFLDPLTLIVRNETGLALDDLPANKIAAGCTFQVSIDGSRVNDGITDRNIAGLITISQLDLATASGIITGFDWVNGFILVSAGGFTTRVQINDPDGNFDYHAISPDPRFTIDPDNPTIAAATGYPMCFPCPRTTPPDTDCETKCRTANRPKVNNVPLLTFTVSSAVQTPPTSTSPGVSVKSTTGMSPYAAAPFIENDLIFWAGLLMRDAVGYYISAHEISCNSAIYTAPQMEPSYVNFEVALMGVGGVTISDQTEASDRSRFEGSCTDPGTTIFIAGKEYGTGSQEGKIFLREWGQGGSNPLDESPPGRWRIRPLCEVTAPTDRDCVMGPQGFYNPPVREVEARTRRVRNTDTQYNGIVYGSYGSPLEEYIFPEPRPGTSVLVESDFAPFFFISQGGQESGYGTFNKQLTIWPGLVVPPLCTAFTIFPAPSNNILAATTTLASSAKIPLRVSLTNFRFLSFVWTSSLSTVTWTCRNTSNPVMVMPSSGVVNSDISVNGQRICGNATTTKNYNSGVTGPATATLVTSAIYRSDKAELTVTLQANVIGPLNYFTLLPFEVSVNSPGACYDPNPLMTGNEQSFVQSGNWLLNTRATEFITPRPASTITVVRSTGGYWASGTSNPTFVSMHTIGVTFVNDPASPLIS